MVMLVWILWMAFCAYLVITSGVTFLSLAFGGEGLGGIIAAWFGLFVLWGVGSLIGAW